MSYAYFALKKKKNSGRKKVTQVQGSYKSALQLSKEKSKERALGFPWFIAGGPRSQWRNNYRSNTSLLFSDFFKSYYQNLFN